MVCVMFVWSLGVSVFTLSFFVCMFFFFFKQKTAYEMRISDWSSDVCSSDLLAAVDEQINTAVAVDDGHRQRQRRMRHIAAADVEQPGNRFRQGQHQDRKSVV